MTVTILFALIGLLCLTAFALVLAAGVVYFRQKNAASDRVPAPAPPAPPPPVAPAVPPLSSDAVNLPDDGYSEDEMPTVVVAAPDIAARTEAIKQADAERAAASSDASTARRSAGATIIAFDDDDDDDDDL